VNGALLAVSQTPAAHGAQFGGGVIVAVIIVLLLSSGGGKKGK
jgi:hypothetical protein